MCSTTTEWVMWFVAEGEIFQVKKPSHSKRIVKQLKKESLRDKTDEAVPVKFEVSLETEPVCVLLCLRVCLGGCVCVWYYYYYY